MIVTTGELAKMANVNAMKTELEIIVKFLHFRLKKIIVFLMEVFVLITEHVIIKIVIAIQDLLASIAKIPYNVKTAMKTSFALTVDAFVAQVLLAQIAGLVILV